MRNAFDCLSRSRQPSASRATRRLLGVRPGLEDLGDRIVPATLSIVDGSNFERGGMMVFEVRLSEASTQSITVDYSTADGTARARHDYQATSGTLTFEPGQTTALIYVPIRDDNKYEPEESFAVNLTNAINANIADAQALGSIIDDDPERGGGRPCGRLCE